jgi:cellulose synthase/poly-beta-1,6-N-acetylglucosamine synthase-like glycosyltransferase
MTENRSHEFRSPALIVLTVSSWLVVCALSWRVYEPVVPIHLGEVIRWLLFSFHVSWMLFWLWGIHNFWHQTLTMLLPSSKSHRETNKAPFAAPVAILYTTCDDFDEVACTSCLKQDGVRSRLLICDDSRDEASRRQIDDWVRKIPAPVTVVRRTDRSGFKAGNLNHAIGHHVDEEFIIVCDADEVIPSDFAARLIARFSDPHVAFVQANHIARTDEQSRFARLHGPSLNLFFRYCLPLRSRFGFVACFGHGVMIRRSAWVSIGGFPEIVSEDIGFAARALTHGYRGVYAPDIVAEEAFPATYSAFVSRLRRVVRGTIGFFQSEYPQLVRSPHATWTEKLDVLLTFSYCLVGIVAVINLIGGLTVWSLSSGTSAHRLSIWLWLLYLLGPHTPLLPLVINIVRWPIRYVPFTFMAATAYASVMPTLAVSAVIPAFGSFGQRFDPTGRIARRRIPGTSMISFVKGKTEISLNLPDW